jgi:hypothetical protein
VPAGIELELAHAKLLKAIAYAKVKTDAVDSDTLAQLVLRPRGDAPRRYGGKLDQDPACICLWQRVTPLAT